MNWVELVGPGQYGAGGSAGRPTGRSRTGMSEDEMGDFDPARRWSKPQSARAVSVSENMRLRLAASLLYGTHTQSCAGTF